MAQQLINQGADIDIRNNKGDTVRSLIYQSQNDDLYQILAHTTGGQKTSQQEISENRKKIMQQYSDQKPISIKRRNP